MSIQNSDNNKNLVIAVLVFFAVTFCVDYFFGVNNNQSQDNKTIETTQKNNLEIVEPKLLTVEQALLLSPRVDISNDNITGSVNLKGGLIDNILLLKYKETTKKNSNNVTLFAPKDSKSEYYFAIDYKDITNDIIISKDTVWKSQDKNNESGAKKSEVKINTSINSILNIERKIKLDNNYLITITDKITNTSSKSINLSKSVSIVRNNPKTYNYAVVHEGLIGNTDGKIKEIKYDKIKSSKSLDNCSWFGFTDIYWLCALVSQSNNTTIKYSKLNNDAYYIASDNAHILQIDSGKTIEISYDLFAGPKDINLLNSYQSKLNIDKFNMAIDFGWFFIITKPLIQFMGILENLFHNMGFVILLLTIIFRLLTYPLMKKSFVSMAKMKKIQPKIASLQKLYANDKFRMNQELVAIYRKENISPLSGCLPMLLQAPIFFCLYKVFFISISMRHAPLFGWVNDLSAPDTCYLFNLFGLLDWIPPSFLQIGLWPLIMGASMFIQQKLSNNINTSNKTQEQQMQEKMMLFMPILFTYICASFPVSIVVYWTISNIIGILQQKYVNKQIAKEVI